ncbi:ricin-type beta-trefoil lectin domain protein [Actinoplanes sp. CA-015351]|uniref:ricin-type beta-trefoil lectin domain protein n=1 Tax=Actinoplanes sp. CA-015351 TaxID=3239897 RepID=UPI003D96B72E
MRTDRGSLPIAVLISILALSISGLLSSALLSQVKDVRRVADRGMALGSAEAGLQVAMGQIRAAVGADGKGKPSALPCGSLQGTISSAAGNAYRVDITYLSSTGGQLSCPPLYAPATASLKAWDVTDGSAGGTARTSTVKSRVLEATYTFRVPNAQVPMGLIHNYPGGELCMDSLKDQPEAGDEVWMMPCDSQRPHTQMFAYVKSMALTHPKPALSSGSDMCLDATRPSTGTSVVVTFQPCVVAIDDTTTQSPPRQLWTLHASHASFAGTDDALTLNGWCINLQNPGAKQSRLIYAKCPSTVYNSTSTMQPEPSVGAGAAGESTQQLVNYQQFGRCMDVTEGNVIYGYLIAWPCTANPVPANISWNQRFTLPAVTDTTTGGTGRVTATKGSVTYCLRSPRSAATGQYVIVVACATSIAAEVTWTRYVAHKDTTKAYTVVDSAGLCLYPSETELYTRLGDKIGRIKVGACDGSLLQKWNAIVAPSTGLSKIQEK